MKLSEQFANELQVIEGAELREKVAYILDNLVDERHAIEPASSTGKYHPSFALGEGGLVRHTKAVVFLVHELSSCRDDIDLDTLIAAAILHDMNKYIVGNPHTVFEHPMHMALLCDSRGMHEVGRLIESHMGKWNTSKRSTVILPIPEKDDEWLLHYADYLASRTWYVYREL